MQSQQNVVMKNRQNVLKQVNQLNKSAKISADTQGSASLKSNLPLI